MKILINQAQHELPAGATLADAVALVQPRAPFAAAVNLRFVPNTQYARQPLADGDRVEFIAPVTGG